MLALNRLLQFLKQIGSALTGIKHNNPHTNNQTDGRMDRRIDRQTDGPLKPQHAPKPPSFTITAATQYYVTSCWKVTDNTMVKDKLTILQLYHIAGC